MLVKSTVAGQEIEVLKIWPGAGSGTTWVFDKVPDGRCRFGDPSMVVDVDSRDRFVEYPGMGGGGEIM